jgi:type IV pilus assembly protein PilV
MMNTIKTKYPKKTGRQAGYLMVEVLVSMTILLAGVVGIVKLQHVAKNSNAQASQRTIASNLADSLIERIRSNTAGIAGYFPDDTTVVLTGNTPTPGQLCASLASTCTPEQLAAFDIWEWEQHLMGGLETVSGVETGGLVNPTVCLDRPDGGGDGFYQIAVAWHGQSIMEYQDIGINENAQNCGKNDANYDESSGDNVYRRIHWQEIFLDV